MKKLFALSLAVVLLPVIALADYSAALNMTMTEYIKQYNNVQAALGAPYIALEKPTSWTLWNGYHTAWFNADKDNAVTITLLTKDPSDAQLLTSGLDRVQIFAKSEKDLIALISVADRCANVFSTELFGVSFSALRVTNIIRSYYENNCKEKKMTSYQTIDDNNEIALSFFFDGSYYYFDIAPLEVLQ